MARDVAKEWAMFEELMIATFGDHWHAPAMRHLEIDQRTLQRWEAGDRPISLRAWEKITKDVEQRAYRILREAHIAGDMWRAALAEVRAQPTESGCDG